MGASPKTKSDFLRVIESKQSAIAGYEDQIARAKTKLANPNCVDKAGYKSDIANFKSQIARLKGEISVLKMKMKDAPKG